MTDQEQSIQTERERLAEISVSPPLSVPQDRDPEIVRTLARLNQLAARVYPQLDSVPAEPAPPPSDTGSGLADDPELIGDFLVEAREHLTSAETVLLTLEKDPRLPDAVNSVFRSFHTIKGLAGFLALGPIQAVAHETETILHHAREGRISITPKLIDLALKAADYLRVAVDALASKPPREAMQSLPSNAGLIREMSLASFRGEP